MNYTKINNVMNYIPKSLRNIQGDDDQWLSWALQSLRTVNTVELKCKNFALLEIVDHKAKLPKGLKRISSIKMLDTSCHNEANIASFNKCISFESVANTVDNVTTTTTASGDSNIHYFNEACAINVQLFQASLYYRNCFKPIRYIGPTGSNYFTNTCHAAMKNNCYTTFSITADKCLMMDISSGIVCIEYESEIQDDDGNFLVPTHPQQLWQGMAHYSIAQHWLNRSGSKEQNSYQMFERHLSISRNYMREAKSIFRMQNISFSLLNAITYDDIKFMRLPAVWSYKTISQSIVNNG